MFHDPGSFSALGFIRVLLVWLLAIFLLPLLALQFLRLTVILRSNGSNARALALFVVLDMALAALVFGPHAETWIWLGLLAAALACNLWVMSFALKLEA